MYYRAATRDDLPFIIGHWVDSYVGRGQPKVGGKPLTLLRKHYRAAVRATVVDVLSRPSTHVVIACCRLDPKVIYGFVALDASHDFPVVHYCYVKELFRGMDIGSTLVMLARDGKPGVLRYTFWTRSARRFVPEAQYDASLVTRAKREV